MDPSSFDAHKFYINFTSKCLKNFQFQLESIFIVVEFPSWTGTNETEATHQTYRFPPVNVQQFHEQILYPYHSEPAVYQLTNTQFRELLATKPLICEVC